MITIQISVLKTLQMLDFGTSHIKRLQVELTATSPNYDTYLSVCRMQFSRLDGPEGSECFSALSTVLEMESHI